MSHYTPIIIIIIIIIILIIPIPFPIPTPISEPIYTIGSLHVFRGLPPVPTQISQVGQFFQLYLMDMQMYIFHQKNT